MEVNTDNYFAFYDLAISLQVDLDELEAKFYKFSKTFHPDFFLQASEEEQKQVMDLASFNNKAYKTLQDPNKRLQYVLQQLGVLIDGEKYPLPPAFLMEMMEINEELMELQFEPDPEKQKAILSNINNFEQELAAQAEPILAQRDTTQLAEDQLLQLKDYYYKKKYLRRIHDSMAKLEKEN